MVLFPDMLRELFKGLYMIIAIVAGYELTTLSAHNNAFTD